MPRPRKHRKINCCPAAYYFKPRAVPLSSLEEVTLEIDELESLRLADFLALSHEQAAEQMKISRATFGRIVEKARKKVVDAILYGKALKISSDLPVELKEKSTARCKLCGSVTLGKTKVCNKCKNKSGETNETCCTHNT
jgi:uncharacterized protein